MDESTREILALCAVIGLGLAVGKLTWRGISLGTSGVLFVALAAGHFGLRVPPTAGVLGIVLFVYCLGLGAGPSFLRMVFQQGKALAAMAVAMIVAAGAVAWLVARGLGLSADLASGLFAGALTSTPALAAASERLPADSDVAVGFGIAYPFGVVGVILFVQLAPQLLARLPGRSTAGESAEGSPITRMLVQIANPNVTGKPLRDVGVLSRANCQVSRVLVEGRLQPIPPAFQLELGQRVLVVGAQDRLADVVEVLGERCEIINHVLDVEQQRRRIVVTARDLIGQSLRELHLRSRFGVTITRITRQDIEFVPSPEERIQFGDILIAVGESAGLDRFVAYAGHRERTADETDLISLSAGLMLGVVVGRVELAFGGEAISLGLAGGPLLVGLVLGHLGHVGPIAVHMPRAARLLLGEIGLTLFLAQAGSQAGGNFIPVLSEHGLSLGLGALVIVAVPLIVGSVVARCVLHLGILETLGGICGAMTSTPGLGAVTSAVDSSRPATSYATVYPLALVLVTLLAPVLIALLS